MRKSNHTIQMTIEVDLHGMDVWDARSYLNSRINAASLNVKEVVVIHGYRGGTALRDFIRKNYSHPRLKRKFVGMNQGMTILVLK